jgi:hypothetical protein
VRQRQEDGVQGSLYYITRPCLKNKQTNKQTKDKLGTGNPSYLRGRDQEDWRSKPAQANRLQELILKKTHHKKRAGGVAQGIGPELKP